MALYIPISFSYCSSSPFVYSFNDMVMSVVQKVFPKDDFFFSSSESKAYLGRDHHDC